MLEEQMVLLKDQTLLNAPFQGNRKQTSGIDIFLMKHCTSILGHLLSCLGQCAWVRLILDGNILTERKICPHAYLPH
jgi:hypothetical protein